MMDAMNNAYLYETRRMDTGNTWIKFLFLGWSYGSFGKMTKQVLFYLTFGGLGFWTLYVMFTLSKKIKQYNHQVAVDLGIDEKDIAKMGLK